MFTKVKNIARPFWKLLVYACQIEILEALVCLLPTSNIEAAVPLDASTVSAIDSDDDVLNGNSFSVNNWLLPDISTRSLKNLVQNLCY